jgi:hypothetical protein
MLATVVTFPDVRLYRRSCRAVLVRRMKAMKEVEATPLYSQAGESTLLGSFDRIFVESR